MEKKFIKTKKVFFSFILLVGSITALHFFNLAQDTDLTPLLNKISRRQDSYPKYDSWKVSVMDTTTKMNKNWQPKEVKVIKKLVTVINQEQTEEVLEVLVTKKGVTKDITKKYIQEANKQKEKERKRKGKKEDNGGTFTLSDEEIFPFRQEKRESYNYLKLEDSYLEDRPVYVLKSKAKTEDEKLWEGKYYIDQESFDVLKLKIKPSKNPKHVKELEFEMSFQVLPGGYFVVKKVRARINGGIFIKRIRMITEEEYSDYEIISSEKGGI